MSVYAQELIRWLHTLGEDAHVSIDDGGLTLVHDEEVGHYYEVGGEPEEEDDDEISS